MRIVDAIELDRPPIRVRMAGPHRKLLDSSPVSIFDHVYMFLLHLLCTEPIDLSTATSSAILLDEPIPFHALEAVGGHTIESVNFDSHRCRDFFPYKELGPSCKPGPWLPVGHFPNSEYSVHPYFRLNCPEVEEPPAVAANPWGLDDSWGVQNPPASEGGW